MVERRPPRGKVRTIPAKRIRVCAKEGNRAAIFERFFLHLEIWNEFAARRGAFGKFCTTFFFCSIRSLVWFGFSKTRMLLAFFVLVSTCVFRDHSGRKQLQQPTSGVRARAVGQSKKWERGRGEDKSQTKMWLTLNVHLLCVCFLYNIFLLFFNHSVGVKTQVSLAVNFPLGRKTP